MKSVEEKKRIRNESKWDFVLFRIPIFIKNFMLHKKNLEIELNGNNKLWKLILLSYSFNELFRVYYTSLFALSPPLLYSARSLRDDGGKNCVKSDKGIQTF